MKRTLKIRKSFNLWLFTGASVLLVASLIVGGWTGYSAWQEREADNARNDSVVVARRAIEGMFGYSYQSVDQQMPKVVDDMTSDFKADWMKVTNDVIAPGAKEKELVVTATIEATGVISASANHTEVMVFMNQKAVGKDPAKGTYDQSKLRVKLDKQSGRWLVSDVDPI
ncbi:h domain protein [Nocardia sp. NPDC051030]|uniref:h domain protein n=1 Tax=Nocardia sp. NPDC051030 TaxID=3155162 RepID=UPI003441EDD1